MGDMISYVCSSVFLTENYFSFIFWAMAILISLSLVLRGLFS